MSINETAGAPGGQADADAYGQFMERFLDELPPRGSELEELHRWVDTWREKCPSEWAEEFEDDAGMSLAVAWALGEES